MSTENNKRQNDIGALWLREANDGKKYYFGKVTINGVETQIVCFKNDRKEPNSKQPDWRIYKSEPRGDSPNPAPRQAPARPAAAPRAAAPRPAAPRPAAPRTPAPAPTPDASAEYDAANASPSPSL